jgi:glycosyltransferase involved in cell wall biosynthesis
MIGAPMCRDTLLYVAPVMPRQSGNGLAMRAASLLDALARRFRVDLFVAPVAGDAGPPEDAVIGRTARRETLDLAAGLDPLLRLIARIPDPAARARAERAYPRPYASRFCGPAAGEALAAWSRPSPPAAIQVMRLYLAPLAEPFLQRPGPDRPFCVLDLDDDEVRSHERLARLHEAAGDPRAAALALAEAAKYRALAEAYFPRFDRIITCSDGDAARIAAAFPKAKVAVVPNSYRPLDLPLHRAAAASPLSLLFVGNLGYFPNIDAALFLCHEILPALRRQTARAIRLAIAGQGAATLRERITDADVTLHDGVPDLTPLYAAADAAVVPLRAGGGTRIKLLEAFAHGVPAVATPLGSEGIDAIDGTHLLLADDADGFARACLRVKAEPSLAAALARHAAALLRTRYGPAQVDAGIAAVYAAVSSGP